jgi:hypothetical protein
MATEGLERLGYHNGQRLEAADLLLEQHYHIDVRRLLNRGLFTPGVVSGLEVEKIVRSDGSVEGRKVRVRLGVAIDPLGREIVLREDTEVEVPNQPPTTGIGYFLIARYSEQLVAGGDPWCGGPDGAPTPARVREEPVLEWSEDVPTHRRCQRGDEGVDCGVLLALVVLDASCEVDHVLTGVREYARPTHVSQVQAFSFEGEKDIDLANAKELNFRIRGGAPASVALYLWGGKFSSLFYTELGRHAHLTPSVSLSAEKVDLNNHTHGLVTGGGTALSDGSHRHRIKAEPEVFDKLFTFDLGGAGTYHDRSTEDILPFIEDAGSHSHGLQLTGSTSGPNTNESGRTHTHSLTAPASTNEVGNVSGSARSGNAHTYLDDLRVALDDQDITQLILDRYVPQSWGTLGNGQANHPFNDKEGTGPIDLVEIAAEIGVDLGAESHRLTFSVQSGGGKVLYNLYVA